MVDERRSSSRKRGMDLVVCKRLGSSGGRASVLFDIRIAVGKTGRCSSAPGSLKSGHSKGIGGAAAGEKVAEDPFV